MSNDYNQNMSTAILTKQMSNKHNQKLSNAYHQHTSHDDSCVSLEVQGVTTVRPSNACL